MGTQDRKQEILDVCLNTYIENGLANTSTRDLCTALEMNSDAVFYYFKNKEA